jgi:hypothetical protein
LQDKKAFQKLFVSSSAEVCSVIHDETNQSKTKEQQKQWTELFPKQQKINLWQLHQGM